MINAEVKIFKPRTNQETSFAKLCLDEKLFKKNIGVIPFSNNVNIIQVGDMKVGIVLFNVYKTYGVKHAEPLLFIKTRSIFTQKIFFLILYQVFIKDKISSIIFKIYSDNLPMKNIMLLFRIPYIGRLKDVSRSTKRSLEFYYFDINFFEALRESNDLYV